MFHSFNFSWSIIDFRFLIFKFLFVVLIFYSFRLLLIPYNFSKSFLSVSLSVFISSSNLILNSFYNFSFNPSNGVVIFKSLSFVYIILNLSSFCVLFSIYSLTFSFICDLTFCFIFPNVFLLPWLSSNTLSWDLLLFKVGLIVPSPIIFLYVSLVIFLLPYNLSY